MTRLRRIVLCFILLMGALAIAMFSCANGIGNAWSAPRLSYDRITLYDRYDPPMEQVFGMAVTGVGQAYILAATSTTKVYLRFGARRDSVAFWPAGQTIAVVLKDGKRLEATDMFAVSPMDGPGRGAPIWLGKTQRWVDPKETEQGHNGRGVLIFAGFDAPMLRVGDVAAIEICRRSK